MARHPEDGSDVRADAAQRRERIVREARRLFAERGGDIPLDAVADAAGVGIATLYRNFDSRGALLDEVALAILGDISGAAARATAALAGETPDDGPAVWDAFVRRLVDLHLGALTAALAEHATSLSVPVREAQYETLVALDALMVEARSAGLVRDDLSALELVIAIGTVTRPQPEAVRRIAPDLESRLVTILLAGMRPGA